MPFYYTSLASLREARSTLTLTLCNDEESVKRQQIFLRLLRVGNTELITQFLTIFYLQKLGLAMGVADSPDLANLYGYEFERRVDIMNDPRIPFYGRYIDDIFALVYASSESEAIDYMKNKVVFDNCVIEWDASAYWQPFLDMCIYRDEVGNLQHMPYRKARNHVERIPWISYHPLDVKRGTFIGEMSRLATLSSTRRAYFDAMEGLVALYVKRGYPYEVVTTWLKNNVQERWEKRLNVDPRQRPEVLVLKTEYNVAWNYFNAAELGDTILGYWKEYLRRADNLEFNSEFPSPDGDLQDLSDCRADALQPFYRTDGTKVYLPDVRKSDILNRRLITSRKRTRNLFDLTSLWKKIVIEKLDERVGEEIDPPDLRQRNVSLVRVEGPRPATAIDDSRVDDEVIQLHERSSPVPDAWRTGTSSWGAGAL